MVAACDTWGSSNDQRAGRVLFGDVKNIQGDDLLLINQLEFVSCYGICVK